MVGQYEAKRTLSVGIYQHYKRLVNNHELKRQQAAAVGLQQNDTFSSGSHHQHISGGTISSNMFQQSNYGPSFIGSEGQTIAQLSVPSIRPMSMNGVNGVNQQQSYTAGSNFTCRNLQTNDEESVRLEKSNIMLLGPSGVGKTFVTQGSLALIVNKGLKPRSRQTRRRGSL